MNDLWRYDGTNWTWISGSETSNAPGTYGTPGQAAAADTPGARYFPNYWKDSTNNFWLFGGKGFDASGTQGLLSDVWKFNGTQWTWIDGTNTVDTQPVVGTKGTAAAGNTPGGRERASTWSNGTSAWVFGGEDPQGGVHADLWKFDGTNWAWVAGPSAADASGTYGTMGTAAAANAPGGRQNAASWIDAAGALWLYGGYGFDSAGTKLVLDDLWKFDGTNWTWVSGVSTGSVNATYGTMGNPSSSNNPGSRESAFGWVDAHGTIWVMGGTRSHGASESSDLWRFDGTTWTWVRGSNTANAAGTYGSLGTAASTNNPGGRDSSTTCTDPTGNLWLYGGFGLGASAGAGNLGDLWRYQP